MQLEEKVEEAGLAAGVRGSSLPGSAAAAYSARSARGVLRRPAAAARVPL